MVTLPLQYLSVCVTACVCVCVCVHSPAAESAEVLWEASPEDTTATLSIGVPADTEAAVAAGTGVEVPGDGIMPAFLGATTTLL